MWRLLILLFVAALPARAEEIVLGLSQDEVAITATFEGSDILIFGAIKRAAPPPEDEGDLGVIITVAGPDSPVTVRRKDRRFGIWVNTDAVDIDIAPTFYAVATSGPLSEILSAEEDATRRVTISRAIRSVGAATDGESDRFVAALIRIRGESALYQIIEGGVDLSEETLFRSRITLPANLTEGDYTAEIFLTRGGTIVDLYATDIAVRKVGLERWLYRLAHDQAVLYGLMSLAIAIAAGWGASAAFGLLRR